MLFAFTNGDCAPPANAYKFEPNRKEIIPKDRQMNELKFDMIKEQLFGLTLLDDKKEDAIIQIKETQLTSRSKSIHL